MTDDEINRCFESVMFDPNSDPSREAIGRAILAAHTAKLLAGVELPKAMPAKNWQHDMYTADQLQQYAAAAAAQARMKALGEVTDLLREYDMIGSSFSMDVAELRWKP